MARQLPASTLRYQRVTMPAHVQEEPMEYGIGIDASLGLTFAEQRTLVLEARERGYTSAWTPSGPINRDGFQVCGQWAAATAADPAGALTTGIAVIPAPLWTVTSLASQAGTLSDLSGGRFILGLGTGVAYSSETRETYGLPDAPMVAVMRDTLTVLRGLLASETVTHDGKWLKVKGLRLAGRPLRVPLYISSLGPQMLRLAGELADGICLNWATPAQRAWCREQVAEGARRVGRDPAEVALMEYIRVCVAEDAEDARRAFARAFLSYPLVRPGASREQGYRAHFTRMGYDEELRGIEAMRDRGASADDLAAAFSDDFLHDMGYFGSAAEAGAAFERLAEGLDMAVVRIVSTQPGLEPALATMRACAPRR